MSKGMDGFGERAEADDSFALTIGSVLGVRWFWLPSPDFYRESPVEGDRLNAPWSSAIVAGQYIRGGYNPFDPVLPVADIGGMPRLRGQLSNVYPDGVSEAECNDWARRPSSQQRCLKVADAGALLNGAGAEKCPCPDCHQPPVAGCGCGFWAYWKPGDAGGHSAGSNEMLPVLGVIEGTGRVIHGEKGFRAQRAKIVALQPAFRIETSVNGRKYPAGVMIPLAELLEHRRKVRERLDNLLYEIHRPSPFGVAVGNLSSHMADMQVRRLYTEVQELDQRIAEAEKLQDGHWMRVAQDWAAAWHAAIETGLAQLYPSARIYATDKAMLANHPPGKGYLFS